MRLSGVQAWTCYWLLVLCLWTTCAGLGQSMLQAGKASNMRTMRRDLASIEVPAAKANAQAHADLERQDPVPYYECWHLCNKEHSPEDYLPGQDEAEVQRVQVEREAGVCEVFWDDTYELPHDIVDPGCSQHVRCVDPHNSTETFGAFGICVCVTDNFTTHPCVGYTWVPAQMLKQQQT
mmetsp:Transcript_70211/g.121597  ORF Transcript_70211/g.121597 Transcript_70211/m.121597 type:complete len:179 (-) Transcript_70211:102-638(-)